MRRVLVTLAVVAGGLVAVGQSSAAPLPFLISCDAHGRIKVNSPDFSVSQPVRYKGVLEHPNPSPGGLCAGEAAATVGNLARVTFTLKGSASCADVAGDMHGTLRLTYANIDPSTSKPYYSAAAVRLEHPNPSPTGLPDAVAVHGEVFKGFGAGADLDATVLAQPIPTEDLDGNGKVDVPTETGGPTMDSFLTWEKCLNGTPDPSPGGLRWDTDGAGLLTLDGEADAVLQSAFTLTYDTPDPSPTGTPIVDCDGSGKLTWPNPTPTGIRARGTRHPDPTPTGICEGSSSTVVGSIAKTAFTLTGSGASTCADLTTPMHGKLTLTYTNIDPVTTKPYNSAAYVHGWPCPSPTGSWSCSHNPAPATLLPGEAACLTGIVAKGIGAGHDLEAVVLLHAITTEDLDENGTIDLPTNGPTEDSYLTWQRWQDSVKAGTPDPSPDGLWSTTGEGYGALLGDPAAVLDGGITIWPNPSPDG